MNYGKSSLPRKNGRSGLRQNDAIEEIGRKYLNEKMSAREIADDMGLSLSTVRQYIRMGNFQRKNN